jgi:hypothetical protein
MSKFYSALALSSILLVFSNCSSFYQAAQTPTPIVKQKGDANIFISMNEAQLAYAITDNIGVMATGHLSKQKQSFFSDTAGVIAKLLDNQLESIEARGYLSYQFGGFYFQELDATKSLQAGLLAGYYQPSMMIEVERGLFKKNTDENLAYKCFKGDLFLNYVHSTKYVDFITSLKFTGLQYNDKMYTEPLVAKQLGKIDGWKQPEMTAPYFFVEPSVTVQYGFSNLKFRVQAFMSQALNDNQFSKSQAGATMGLNYQFGTMPKKEDKYKKKKKKTA